MLVVGLTPAQQATQEKAGRGRDTQGRKRVVADITAAILQQLLLGLLQLLALFTQSVRGLTGRTGDLIDSFMGGLRGFV
jgi:hypothetical protein